MSDTDPLIFSRRGSMNQTTPTLSADWDIESAWWGGLLLVFLPSIHTLTRQRCYALLRYGIEGIASSKRRIAPEVSGPSVDSAGSPALPARVVPPPSTPVAVQERCSPRLL